MTNYFIRNRETMKLELHFEKAMYTALTDDQKAKIKSNFVWGRRSGCWISRAKEPHLYSAIKCAAAVDETPEEAAAPEEAETLRADLLEKLASDADIIDLSLEDFAAVLDYYAKKRTA